MSNDVKTNMGQIQSTFLGVQEFMQQDHTLEDLTTHLDSLPSRFRSVAYESASMQLGLHELTASSDLYLWNQFYEQSRDTHSFHIEIGLGWAQAKTSVIPDIEMWTRKSISRTMICDGIGYYFSLFKGRSTILNQQIPKFIVHEDHDGFDQGVGRRLWYHAEGNEEALAKLISQFSRHRLAALWRGIGIAWGYVGGKSSDDATIIVELSDSYDKQFKTGLILAAISRMASGAMVGELTTTCKEHCGHTEDNLLELYKLYLNDPNAHIGSFNL